MAPWSWKVDTEALGQAGGGMQCEWWREEVHLQMFEAQMKDALGV